MDFSAVLKSTKEVYGRFGAAAAAGFLTHGALNTFLFADCLHIIALDRATLQPADPEKAAKFGTSLATASQLETLAQDARWEINETKLRFFRSGDACVLSLVNGQPAGYTWVHTGGRPELIPHLTLSIPADYLYNYAGLTLPEFRGGGLQSYRHHALLGRAEWQARRGLMGYVRAVNFASRKGQAKSGYRKIGSVWLFGTRRHFVAVLTGRLRDMGIRRL